ncbi:MAG: M56 family metallopeptidase [Clostridia bacterium]|nr:M56 family metallopeptidase [Clostridia bacterium]
MTDILLSILSTALTMSVIIILLLLLSKYFGDRFTAKCRYIVWVIVVLRLCMPFGGMFAPKLITLDLSSPEKNINNEYEASPFDNTSVQSPPILSEIDVSDTIASETQETLPNISLDTPIRSDITIEKGMNDKIDTTYVKKLSLPNIETVIFALWLAGAVIFLAVKLLSYNIYRNKLMRRRMTPTDDIRRIYADACKKLEIASPPKLYISDMIGSPLLCGYFGRAIFLPDIKYSDEGLRGILSHELIHHKRGDLWIKLFGVIANSLFFFDPLVYVALSRLDCEMELSCDEKLLSGLDSAARLSYGSFMLEIVRQTSHKKSSLTTFYSPAKGTVKERFINIIEEKTRKHGQLIVTLVLILCTLAGFIIGCGIKKDEDTKIESYFKDGDVINLTPESVEFPEVDFERKEISSLEKYTPADNAINTFLEQNNLYIMSEHTFTRYSNYFELMYENGGDPVCIYAGNAEEIEFEGKNFGKLFGETGFCFSYYVSSYVDVYFSTTDGGIPKPFFKSTDDTSLIDIDRDGEYEIVTDDSIYTTINGKAVKFNIDANVAKHFEVDPEALSIRFPYSSYNYIYSLSYNEPSADDGTYNRHRAKMIYSKGKLTIEPEESEHVDMNATLQTSNKNWKMYKSMKYNAIVLENGDKCYGYAIGSSASKNSISKEFKGKKFAGLSISSDSYVYISKDETRAAVYEGANYPDRVIFINLNTGDVLATVGHSYRDILKFHGISDFVLAPYKAVYSYDNDTYVTEARYTFETEFEELDNAYKLIYTLKTNDEKVSLKGSITYNFSSYCPDEYEVIETTLNGIEDNPNVSNVSIKKDKYSDTVLYNFHTNTLSQMMMYTSDVEGNYFQPSIISPMPITEYNYARIMSFGNYNNSNLLYMTIMADIYHEETEMQESRYFVYMANPDSMLDGAGNPTKPLVWNYKEEISITPTGSDEYGITQTSTGE